MAAMFAANGFAMGAWVPQIPPLMPRHGITESVLGLVILALGVGAVAAMLFSGRLIARFGGKPVLVAFALALIPALPAIVFADSLALLFFAAAYFGAVAGSMDVAMNAQAVTVERSLGRAIMSTSHGFWSLGGFVGSGLGSLVIATWGLGAQALMAATAIAATIGLAIPHLLSDAPVAPEAGYENHLFPRDAALWVLGGMTLLCMVPEGAIMDWAAVYLGKELGADTFRAGLGFAFFAATMAVMRFSGDALRNRFGAVKTLRISGLVGAAGLMVGATAPTDWIAITGFTVAGFGIANMVPVLFSAAGNHPGLPSGQALSTVSTMGYASLLIAPASIGYVAELAGFRATYAALALLLFLVACLASRARAADQMRTIQSR